ncbi:CPBP family glutamic-type intramembrane protease, partial [Bacillus pseudomycoides]|uniref:CPBP family glutamic-type intramembrane protease n=1 Tax=Bacillus pseudomycoides TaxID=64104 RepID=UPI002FFE961E
IKKGDIRICFIFVGIEIINSIIFLYVLETLGLNLSSNNVTSQFSSPIVLVIIPLQLLGEQMILIGTFLFSLASLKILIKNSLIYVSFALVSTGIIFGLLHLLAYNWNLLHCVLIIGIPCIWQIAVYIYTRNILISFITHTLFDLFVFTLFFIHK